MLKKKVKTIIKQQLSPKQLERIRVTRVSISLLARTGIILKQVSYPSAVTATLVAWVFGAIWYSPLLFADLWLASPATIDSMEGLENPLLYPLASAGTTFVYALVIAGLAGLCGIAGWTEGFIFSIWVGLGLVVVNMAGGYLFLKVSVQVALVDMAYLYIKTLILCLFAALWHKKDTQLYS